MSNSQKPTEDNSKNSSKAEADKVFWRLMGGLMGGSLPMMGDPPASAEAEEEEDQTPSTSPPEDGSTSKGTSTPPTAEP
jgi:hypothetical protein